MSLASILTQMGRGEQSPNGIHAQHRGMLRGRLQTAHGFFDYGWRERGQLGRRFAHHPLGECRTRGDGSGAPAGQEPGLGHTASFETRGKPHHVAASRIGDVHLEGRRRKFTRVARGAEVVKQTLAVHSCFNYR